MSSASAAYVRMSVAIAGAAATMMSCTDVEEGWSRAAVDEPVTLMGAGDIAAAGYLMNASATGDLIRNANPTYAFTLGDNAYPSGTDADFANNYEPTWGSFKAITLPTPGNHEYQEGAAGYVNYFGLAVVSADADPARLWYARDLGNGWRFYSLNTEVSTAVGSPQETWLRTDLAAHPGLHFVAVAHRPRYASGVHGDSTVVCPLWNALQAAGGDLFVMGHEHHYERYAKMDCDGALSGTGVRQFVVGTGGASLYALGPPRAGQEVAWDSDFGVLELVLHDASYEWRFIASGRCASGDCPSRNGLVLDEGIEPTNHGPPRDAVVIQRAVAASADDAEENAAGEVYITSTDLELVTDGTINQRVGLRFASLAIPRGATITRAYVQLTVDETVGSTGLALTIRGFAQDHAAAFTTTPYDIGARPVTAAAVTGWSPPLWTTVGAAGVDQRTPELRAIVQEIVNRPGWAAGNALGLVVTGPGGVRTAAAFDRGTGWQPVLYVEYTTSSASSSAPIVSARPDEAAP